MPWGASFPPLAAAPLEIRSPRAGAPPGPYIYVGRERAAAPQASGASPPSRHASYSLRRAPAKPCRISCCIHHHAVVLLDLQRPPPPPCWIKKEVTLLHRTCVERGGAVRSALDHR